MTNFTEETPADGMQCYSKIGVNASCKQICYFNNGNGKSKLKQKIQIRHHSFSKYAKFSEKLTFHIP